MSHTTLIVGVGSPHGNDRAGWCVVERLLANSDNNDSTDVQIQFAKSPLDIVHWLDDCQRLVVCDACRGLGKVGDVQRWQWPTTDVLPDAWSGTHDFSLPAALSLAKQLGRLPDDVRVWGIEIGELNASLSLAFDGSESLAPDLDTAISLLANQIVNDLKRHSITGLMELPEVAKCTNTR